MQPEAKDQFLVALSSFLQERQWQHYFSEHEWQELYALYQSEYTGLNPHLHYWSRLLTSWDTRSLELHRPVYEQVREILNQVLELSVHRHQWTQTEQDALRLGLAETQVQLQQKQLLFWRFEQAQKQQRVTSLVLENEQAQAEVYNLSELTQFVGHQLKGKTELIQDALDGLMGVLDAAWTALYIYADPAGEQGTFYILRHETFQIRTDFPFPHSDFWDRFWRGPVSQTHLHDALEPTPELNALFPGACSLMAQALKMPNGGRGLLLAVSDEYQAFSGFRQLFSIFGAHLASALQNAHLHAQINELAIRDALTGLFNRRHLEERLTYSFELSRRYSRQLAVLMIDIDHFKALNDNHGHPFGDLVLIEVAQTLQRRLRSTDIIGRYGGEEFMAILQETGLAGARTVSEDLVRRVSELRFTAPDATCVQVTVSVGFAAFPEHVQALGELVKMADDGLYLAKNQGRNQVGFTGLVSDVLQ